MSRKTFKKISGAALSLVLTSGFLAACGRNAEEYRRSRVLEERARAEAVTGDYAGIVKDPKGEEDVGLLEVTIKADSRVRPSQDGTRSEETSVLVVSGTFTSSRAISVSFQDATYDFETGVMKAIVPVEMRNGVKTSLSITGTFAGDRQSFEGRFGVDSYPEQAGRVKLLRGASIDPPRPQSEDGSLEPTDSFNQSYIGQLQTPVLGTQPAGLKIESVTEAGVMELVDYFSPIRQVRLTVRFSKEFDLEFDEARWDRTAKMLRATEDIVWGSSAGHNTVTVECREKRASDARFTSIPAFNCQLWSSVDAQRINASFEPTDADYSGDNVPPFSGAMIGETTRTIGGPLSIPVKLIVDQAQPTEAGEFDAIFRRDVPVRVTLALSPQTQLVFTNARWNTGTRRLVGEVGVEYGGHSTTARLNCEGETARLPTVMTCTFRAGARAEARVFGVGPAADMENPPAWSLYSIRYVTREDGQNLYLDLKAPIPSAETELREFIDGIRTVRAEIRRPQSEAQIFPTLQWHLNSGLLVGEFQGMNGNQAYTRRLDCREKAIAPGAERGSSGWDCDFSSSLVPSASRQWSFQPAR